MDISKTIPPLRHSASSPSVKRHRPLLDTSPDSASEHKQSSLFLREFEKRELERYQTRAENYACNICFDIADNAVVTSCGHLHCWTCLYQWMTLPSQSAFPTCPVCKSACDLSTLTPIYGRGDHSSMESATPMASETKQRTLSSSSQSKPKNILDQWLAPHIYPPTLPILPAGQTPARPTARYTASMQKQTRSNMFPTATSSPPSMFGGTHPVVIFSAGITTLCGMQMLNSGGFSAANGVSGDDNTSKMMCVLAMAIIAGVWFH